jgi:hypothetical protein
VEDHHWAKRIPWWVTWLFVGGFGLAGAFGATVLPLDLQLVGFVSGCVLMAIATFGTAWHLIREIRERRLRVEPAYVIILGLLIAAGGVAWLWMSSNPALSPPSAATPSAPAPKTPGQDLRKLSAADVDERIKAITKAYNIALQARSFADGSSQLLDIQIWPMIKDGKADAFLRKYADDFKPILDQIQDFARVYRSWLPEVDRAFLGSPSAPFAIGLYKNTLDLRQEILNWQNRPYWLDHIEKSAVMADWRRSVSGLRDWVNQAIDDLAKLRREYASQ